MQPRSLSTLLLIALYVITSAATCEDTSMRNVAFEAAVQLTPGNDTMRAGDTLWVDMALPQTFYDAAYKRTIRLPDSMHIELGFEVGLMNNPDEHIALTVDTVGHSLYPARGGFPI
ncbi:hypothetical protein MKQ68_15495 [Chitinophaga horti]|uniref:Uncharacterized protein n=1 Tax=Chitinophaga horti TaxID=2920382 RepID=A0ABY6IZS8_9BACT|nr:hypothetical protein [Chitinophaga horti]UYQ91494.1 hypothetical protein MKQ68_15495 [Chitinophaga horti]